MTMLQSRLSTSAVDNGMESTAEVHSHLSCNLPITMTTTLTYITAAALLPVPAFPGGSGAGAG